MEAPNRPVLVVDLTAQPSRAESSSDGEGNGTDAVAALLGADQPTVETVTSVDAAVDAMTAERSERTPTPDADGSVGGPLGFDVVVVRPPADEAGEDGSGVIETAGELTECRSSVDAPVPVIVVAPSLSAETVAALFDVGIADYVPSEVPAVAHLLRHRLDTLTAERRAHRLRKASRDRLPSVLDTVSEAVFAVNPDWHIVYCNRSAESLLGWSVEDVLGERLFEAVELFTDDEAADRLRRSMEDDEPATFEAAVGSSWYDVRTYPSAGGLTVFAQDVTERHERERLFQGVFEGAMDAMVIVDDDGVYVDANPAAVELFGAADESDVIGRSIQEIVPDQYDYLPDGYEFTTAWETFQESGSERGVFPIFTLSGARRVAEFTATPNIVPGKHLSVLRDVTDHPGFPTFAELVDGKSGASEDSAGENSASDER